MKGKKKVFKALLGKMAVETKERADMALVSSVMKSLLEKLKNLKL